MSSTITGVPWGKMHYYTGEDEVGFDTAVVKVKFPYTRMYTMVAMSVFLDSFEALTLLSSLWPEGAVSFVDHYPKDNAEGLYLLDNLDTMPFVQGNEHIRFKNTKGHGDGGDNNGNN